MSRTSRPFLLASIVAIVLSGCASTGRTSPDPTALPSSSPVSTSTAASSPTAAPVAVTSPEQAFAQVIVAEPRLAGIMAYDPDLIGQSSWYRVEEAPAGDGFAIEVRVGWGDCPAGCIDEHTWTYEVATDGRVTIEADAGPPVPAEAWPSPAGTGATGGITTGIAGTVTAGPVCPVERDPPDPACAPRPVAGAVLVVRDAAGTEIARAVADPAGTYEVELPAGTYTIEPQPVEGLLGTPASVDVVVAEGAVRSLDLSYDTGIR
jgi:hypothetical protein